MAEWTNNTAMDQFKPFVATDLVACNVACNESQILPTKYLDGRYIEAKFIKCFAKVMLNLPSRGFRAKSCKDAK